MDRTEHDDARVVIGDAADPQLLGAASRNDQSIFVRPSPPPEGMDQVKDALLRIEPADVENDHSRRKLGVHIGRSRTDRLDVDAVGNDRDLLSGIAGTHQQFPLIVAQRDASVRQGQGVRVKPIQRVEHTSAAAVDSGVGKMNSRNRRYTGAAAVGEEPRVQEREAQRYVDHIWAEVPQLLGDPCRRSRGGHDHGLESSRGERDVLRDRNRITVVTMEEERQFHALLAERSYGRGAVRTQPVGSPSSSVSKPGNSQWASRRRAPGPRAPIRDPQ